MNATPERAAWLAGRDAGEADARMWGATPYVVPRDDARALPPTPTLRLAWLNGYGHGISETAGCVPGHHLSGVVQSGGVRTELVAGG